jgi:hypothetical protein
MSYNLNAGVGQALATTILTQGRVPFVRKLKRKDNTDLPE